MTYRLLLDTSSLIYRAFFALPQSITAGDGQPVNAIHGYLDMTARLLRDYAPDEIVHVYDADWRPAPRVDAYSPYKADRPDEPETLGPQFDWLRQMLDALGMAQAQAPGWEADDAIGSLCADGAAGDRFDIITGDRDLLQLVQDGSDDAPTVRLLFTVRGVSNLDEYDSAAVVDRYGVPPHRYADFAALRGDPSDGLPGVQGIGQKTAARLIREYASLDELLEHTDDLSPRLASNLEKAEGYLAAMQSVVPIRRDVAVEQWRPPADAGAVDRLAEELGLDGPVKRLRQAMNGE
jgi:5'-3' exonuclease